MAGAWRSSLSAGRRGKDDQQAEAQQAAQRSSERPADAHLELRVNVTAGVHTVAVTFPQRPAVQGEDLRPPYLRSYAVLSDFNSGQPHLASIAITGPFNGKVGETASRARIFACRPASQRDERACATKILSTLARRAYRRPVTEADLGPLLGFYEAGRKAAGFEAGIRRALQRLLVSPEFLVRIERDPPNIAPATNYRVSDLELAARLSFFFWSSIPDDELLEVAERGQLKDPAVLERQVRRMLADERAAALVNNFAGQWLYLRNVPSTRPDTQQFPDYDDNLRQAMRRETELLFDSIIREDRSALELLAARYTFVNERLARHYGMPNIYGSHFRRVSLSDDDPRGGLLGQASILTVTAYPNRTSPVIRGKWILENILNAAPPPPPPDVPDLRERSAEGKVLSMRERMVQHRTNPVCATCHTMMDPLGLALEHFDAIGRWRDKSESNEPIDASGTMPDGTSFNGPRELRQALLGNPDRFVTTFTEKLLTYALGRGLTPHDAPAVRAISAHGRAARVPAVERRHGHRHQHVLPDEEIAVMMITRMALPRRTFLRGVGATLALPLLDAMVPALTVFAKTSARPVSRLGFIYVPNGAVMEKWTPAASGRGFEFSPTLAPLEPFRDQTLVVSNLAQLQANSFDDGAGDHSRGTAAWLSGIHAKRTEGADVQLGVTADQIAAREFGKHTQLASLELALETIDLVGNCDNGYGCTYMNTLSWRTPTTPLPVETNPRKVFRRLFGQGDSPAERLANLQHDQSMLDSVLQDVARLQRTLGPADNNRLTEYLDAIRDVERRILRAEEQSVESDLPLVEVPAGIPETFEAHIDLMFDLQLLAYQADVTRVITFLVGRELSNRTYPAIGITDAHHSISHHQNDAEKLVEAGQDQHVPHSEAVRLPREAPCDA